MTIWVADSMDGGGWGAPTAAAHGSDAVWQRALPAAAKDYERVFTGAGGVNTTYSTAIKKYGLASARFSRGLSTDEFHVYTPRTSNWGTSVYARFWFYLPTGAVAIGDIYHMARLNSTAGTGIIAITGRDAGGQYYVEGQVGATRFNISVDTWYLCEYTYDGVTMKLKVNGTECGTLALTAAINDFKIGSFNHEGTKDTSDLHIDDLIIGDVAMPYAEDWRIAHVMPDGDDATDTAFTPSTGSTSWDLIDENPPALSGSADYVASTAANQNELVTLDASAIPSDATIHCVKIAEMITSSGVDFSDLNLRDNDNGTVTNTNLVDTGLLTTRSYSFARYYNVRPSTAGAWTQANVDAFKIGGRRGADGAKLSNMSIDQAYCDVVYVPAPAGGQPILRRSAAVPHMALGQSAVRRRY